MSLEMKWQSINVQLEVVSSLTTAPAPPPPASASSLLVVLESGTIDGWREKKKAKQQKRIRVNGSRSKWGAGEEGVGKQESG